MAQYDRGLKGNTRIRKAGQPIVWNEHTLAEFGKCAEDPYYFITRYVFIKNVDSEQLIPFMPRFYQKEMLEKMLANRFVIVKLPRQCGKTSLTAAVLLWHLIFNSNFSILVAAHKGSKANDVIGNVAEMYEMLPDFLQHGVDTWNKGSIKLETGSRIRASATSGSAARGDVYNLVYLDEFAFVQKHIADEFIKSVIPTISSGKTTKIFVTSTPKGFNQFYDMWKASVEGKSEFVRVEIKWNDVPGRDDRFRETTIAEHGQQFFDQEYGAEFLGSERTLISGAVLGTLPMRDPIIETRNSRVYDKAAPGRKYALTVDVSEGLGADFHAISVIDVTSMPFTLAALYRDNELDPMALPGVIFDMARVYNDALVLVEANFGQQVGEILYSELEYENVVFTNKGKTGPRAKVDQISGGHANRMRIGLAWNAQNKRIGCSNLKTLIETGQLVLGDTWLFDELKKFAVKNASYAAIDGNDDLVMTLVLFAWMADQGYFRAMTDVDVRGDVARLRAEEIESKMTPLGFFPDDEEVEAIVMERDDRFPIEVPGPNGPDQFAGLFDKRMSRGGMTESQLHDMFIMDLFNTNKERERLDEH